MCFTNSRTNLPFLLLVFCFVFFFACVFGFLGNSEKLGFERLMLVFGLNREIEIDRDRKREIEIDRKREIERKNYLRER